MIKLKNIIFSFSMLVVLLLASACSMKKGNPTKSYELLINDSKVVITYTYTEKEEKVLKEKVLKEKVKSTFKYSSYSGLKETEIKKIVNEVVGKIQAIDGIKASVEFKDDGIIEDIELDFEKLDYKKSNEFNRLYFTGELKSNNVTLKEMETQLLQMGFKKIEEKK